MEKKKEKKGCLKCEYNMCKNYFKNVYWYLIVIMNWKVQT